MGNDPAAVQCMTDLVRSLVTATAASSLISTALIGHFGNLPLALAPGIGARLGGRLGMAGWWGERWGAQLAPHAPLLRGPAATPALMQPPPPGCL